MAQYGAAADSAGTRTAPETVQRIIYGQYRNPDESPVLSGGDVAGTGTLAYHVTAGQAVCKVGDGRAVYVVWDDTDTALTTAPATGTEKDVVYVDRDGVVGLAKDGHVPADPWYVTLDVRTIAAGATSTTATTSVHDKNYALVYGVSRGELCSWTDPATTGSVAADSWDMRLPFSLGRDMTLRLELIQAMATDSDHSDINAASLKWVFSLETGLSTTIEMPIDRRWVQRQYTCEWQSVPKGDHVLTVHRESYWRSHSDTRIIHVGFQDGWVPTIYRLWESGLAQ